MLRAYGIEKAFPGISCMLYLPADKPIEDIRREVREVSGLGLHLEMSVDEHGTRVAIDGPGDKPCVIMLPETGMLLYVGHFLDPAETITTECG